MTRQRSHSSRYLTKRLAAAHNVLANPTATDAQRHGARCRLNRTLDILRRLEPIPMMRRGLDVDKEKRPIEEIARAPRRKTSQVALMATAAALAAATPLSRIR